MNLFEILYHYSEYRVPTALDRTPSHNRETITRVSSYTVPSFVLVYIWVRGHELLGHCHIKDPV